MAKGIVNRLQVDILEAQIRSVSGKVVIFATKELRPQYNPVLNVNAHRITIVKVEAQGEQLQLPEPGPFDLVIAVGNDNRDTHNIYARCDRIKQTGLPVVFGVSSRSLAFEAPSTQTAGILMDGAFLLAGMYVVQLPVQGSYIEFGTFDGVTFSTAYHALKNSCDRFFACDSFAGIVGSREDEGQAYVDGAYFANRETFDHNMKLIGADMSRIQTIGGPFQETLIRPASEYGIGPISVCHIDSDVYEAAALALDFVTPHLTQGALLLFDEYNAFGADPNRGERRATREWLARNPTFELELYKHYGAFGTVFFFRRRV